MGRDLNMAKGSSFMFCKLMYVVLVLRGIIVPSSMGKKKNCKIRVLGFQSSQCNENVGYKSSNALNAWGGQCVKKLRIYCRCEQPLFYRGVILSNLFFSHATIM